MLVHFCRSEGMRASRWPLLFEARELTLNMWGGRSVVCSKLRIYTGSSFVLTYWFILWVQSCLKVGDIFPHFDLQYAYIKLKKHNVGRLEMITNNLGDRSTGIESLRLKPTVFHFTCLLAQKAERGNAVHIPYCKRHISSLLLEIYAFHFHLKTFELNAT